MLLYFLTQALIGAFPLGCFCPQRFLELLIGLRVENFPKNLASFLGFRQQELEKLPLGNHRHPIKLRPVQPNQRLHRLCNLPRPCHRRVSIGEQELSICLFHHQFISPFRGPEIFWIAANGVLLFSALKGQFHKSWYCTLRVAASEHNRFSMCPAGFSIQRKGNAIKQCSLSRASFSCN